jgi:uncharacterized protein (DUF849 family)
VVVLVKACLNGRRRPGEHPALPVSPAELGVASAAAVAAGAGALHVHPKDLVGADTLDAGVVAAVVEAVRTATPGTPVGVTTGAWASGSPAERLAVVRAWRVLPDFASVNWHEPGATELAAELLERGVGVEVGLWTPQAVESWSDWPRRGRCLRVLLEVVDDLPAEEAVAAAGRLVEALRPMPGVMPGVPVLLHGEGRSAWPVLAEAVRRGLDVRIGLEDVLLLPDGRPAADNAELVATARDLIRRYRGAP